MTNIPELLTACSESDKKPAPAAKLKERRMTRSQWRQAGFWVLPGQRGEPETQAFAGYERTVIYYRRSQVTEARKPSEMPF